MNVAPDDPIATLGAQMVERCIAGGARDMRCSGCAFRRSTEANGYGPTLAVAAMLVLLGTHPDDDEFGCHMSPGICRGYELALYSMHPHLRDDALS